MGQTRIPALAARPAFSSEDLTRMVCILIRKYGERAPRVARLMSREHLKAGDVERFRAWEAVAERVQLISGQGRGNAPVH